MLGDTSSYHTGDGNIYEDINVIHLSIEHTEVKAFQYQSNQSVAIVEISDLNGHEPKHGDFIMTGNIRREFFEIAESRSTSYKLMVVRK